MVIQMKDVAQRRVARIIDLFKYELETVDYFNKKIENNTLDELLVMEFAQSFIRYQLLSASFAQIKTGVLSQKTSGSIVMPLDEKSALRFSINNPVQENLVDFDYVSSMMNEMNMIQDLKSEYLNRSNHARALLMNQYPDAYYQMYDICFKLIEENPMILTFILNDRLFKHGLYVMVDQTALNITRKSDENNIALAIRQQVFKLFSNHLFFIETHPQVLHNLIIDAVNLYENERNYLTYQQLKGISEITPNVLFNYIVSRIKQNLISTVVVHCTYHVPNNGERYPLSDLSAFAVVKGEVDKNTITFNEFNDYSQSMIDQFYFLETLSKNEIEKLEKDINIKYPDTQNIISMLTEYLIDDHFHRIGLITSKLSYFNTLNMMINAVIFKVYQESKFNTSETFNVIHNELVNIYRYELV